MVRHIVLWSFLQEIEDGKRAEYAQRVQDELQALRGVVPGIRELRVITQPLADSNVDIALLSAFDDEEALDAYQKHPRHVETGVFIKSVVRERRCLDYWEEEARG